MVQYECSCWFYGSCLRLRSSNIKQLCLELCLYLRSYPRGKVLEFVVGDGKDRGRVGGGQAKPRGW